MRDPYTVLGVSRNATEEEIKKAYEESIGLFDEKNMMNQ